MLLYVPVEQRAHYKVVTVIQNFGCPQNYKCLPSSKYNNGFSWLNFIQQIEI